MSVNLFVFCFILSFLGRCQEQDHSIYNDWYVSKVIHLNNNDFTNDEMKELGELSSSIIGVRVQILNDLLKMDCDESNIFCISSEKAHLSNNRYVSVVDDVDSIRNEYKIIGNEIYFEDKIGRDFLNLFTRSSLSMDKVQVLDTGCFLVEEDDIDIKIFIIDKNQICLYCYDYVLLLNVSPVFYD